MSAAAPELRVFDDLDALARGAANWLIGVMEREPGEFAVALAGGSTPRALYTLLPSPPYRLRVPWERAHWFWGDERFVPHGDARSNFRMAYEAMLSRAPAPKGRIHPVPTQEATPERAAAAYERSLKEFYGAQTLDPARPLFAACLLGLGEDGHTASLFPGCSALQEQAKWVASSLASDGCPRITLTLPALTSSAGTVFLVSGAHKRDALTRLLDGDPVIPASHIRAIGNLRIFADREAAGFRGN